MKARLVFLAALVAIAAYADDKPHKHLTHEKTHTGHSDSGAHAHGIGEPGDPKQVSRVIQVAMTDDMKFAPAQVRVKRGETIKFVVRNAGRIKHEMVIGSMVELKQHAELMRKMPGMEHDEPNQIALDPGKSAELIWRFTKAGTVDFACLQAGHFEAGMMGKVLVK